MEARPVATPPPTPSPSRAIEVAPRAYQIAPAPRLVLAKRRETPLTPQGTAPGSYDEGIIHQWAEIRDAYNRGDWRYDVDGESEDRLIAMEERLAQSLLAQTREEGVYERFLRDVRSKRDELGDEGYVEWIHVYNDQMLLKRARSYAENEVVDWGYATRLAPVYEYYGEEIANWIIAKAQSENEEQTQPTFEQLAGVMWTHNKKEGATLIAIDASRKWQWGVTGVGKSQLGIFAACQTHDPALNFHIVNDVVYQADTERFVFLTEKDKRRYRSAIIDESQNFLDKRRSGSEVTRKAGLRYFTKRYLNQFDYLIGPSIFIYDERFVYGQIQFRFHIVKPGFVKVYQWNGEFDEDKDEWGRLVTQFHIPEVPPSLFRTYQKAKALIGEFGSYNEARRKSEAFESQIRFVDAWLERSREANERTRKLGIAGLVGSLTAPVAQANVNNPRESLRGPATSEVATNRRQEP